MRSGTNLVIWQKKHASGGFIWKIKRYWTRKLRKETRNYNCRFATVKCSFQWLAQIEKVEALRTAFFSAGKVPSEVNEKPGI
jgi:hypothetical protein